MIAAIRANTRTVLAVLILVIGAHAAPASGQVVATWTGSTGDWNDPTNWSTHAVPNNNGATTYNVAMSGSGADVELFSGNIAVNNLTIDNSGAILAVSGARLSLVSGPSSNSSTIGLGPQSSLGVGADGSLTNNGTIGGSVFASMSNSGNFVNNRTVSMLDDSGVFNGSTGNFLNSGEVAVDAGGFVNSGVFNTSGTVRVTSSNDPGTFSNSNVLNNTGSINLGLNFNSSRFSNSGVINNSGTLKIDDTCEGGCFTSLSNSGVLNNSGTIAINRSNGQGGDFVNSGTVSDSGSFTTSTNYTQTSGTTTIGGTLSTTAEAVVEIEGGVLEGTGTVNGDVLSAGKVIAGDPRGPGQLTINGDYEQAGGAILDELIGSSSSGLLSVTGDVALDAGSSLEIDLLDGYDPLGHSFDILNYASLTGQFANGSSFWDDNYFWDVDYGPNQAEITAVKSAEPSPILFLALGLLAIAGLRLGESFAPSAPGVLRNQVSCRQ